MTPGLIELPMESMTTAELAVLAMVRKHLAAVRKDKLTGQLLFEVNVQDGGVTSKWATVRIKER